MQTNSKPHLIVVDDEPQVLTAIGDQLEGEYTVHATSTGPAALALLEKLRDVSAILSDQRMPGMHGDELFARAARISDASRVLITGFADLEAVIRAVNNGRIFGYLTKPWSAAELRLVIHKAAEHHQLLRELQHERDLLHNLMDHVPDEIYFKDLSHRYVRINARAARNQGIESPQAAIGRLDLDWISDTEQGLAVHAEDNEVAQSRKPIEVDELRTAADGSRYWVSKIKAPVLDAAGNVTSIVAIARDITARKRTEQALLEREGMLRHAQRMARIGHVAVGPDGRYESVSDTLPELLGLPFDELPRDAESFLERVHPEDRAGFRELSQSRLQAGEGYEAECRIVRPNGQIRNVKVATEWITQPDGSAPTRRFGTLQDVSEQKRDEQEMRLLLDASEAIAKAPDVPEALRSALERLATATGWEYGEAWGQRESGELGIDAIWHRNGHRLEQFAGRFQGRVLQVGASLPGTVWQRREPMWLPDLEAASDLFARREAAAQAGLGSALAVPVPNASGETLAVLLLLGLRGRRTDERMVQIAVAVARQLGNAIERKRLALALREQEENLRLLLESTAEAIYGIDPSGRCTFANPATARLLGYTAPSDLIGQQMHLLVHHTRLDGSAYPPSECPIQRSLLGESGVRVDNEVFWRADGSSFPVEYTSHPILRDGASTGAVVAFTDISERVAKDRRIARLTRMHAMLSGINSTIVRVQSREELFAETCRLAVETGGFRLVYIRLLNEAGTALIPVASVGPRELKISPLAIGGPEAAELRETTAMRAFTERRIQVSNELATSELRTPLRSRALEIGVVAVASLPLSLGARTIGVITFGSGEANVFDDEEISLLEELAGDISFALDHLEKSATVDYLSYYDQVTGLANRTLLHQRLEQQLISAAQDKQKVALAVLDIERFRVINDSLGRQAGDALLKIVANRLSEHAKDATWLARLGADQFAIFVPGVQSEDALARRIETRLQEVFGTAFRVGDSELRVSARAGIALFPNDAADVDTLLRSAEAALNKAKERGERYLFFEQRMTERVAEKLTLESKLRQALEKEQFVLHYQPKVDVNDRSLVGVEALIRWQSPELGLVPPVKFISLLEETGLILAVGTWALRRAALDHRGWVERGLKPGRVAVNVSSIQLRQRDFVNMLKEAVRDGVEPTAIDLEITESLLMEDIQGNIEKLKAVRDLGVKIAIDDFGTGYSSLSYLAKLPLNALKIDRSFIITMLKDPNTMTLVSTMISLAHSLRLKVVAEGVDDDEQANILRLLRCDEMQGYLFSRPLPFEELAALLRDLKILK